MIPDDEEIRNAFETWATRQNLVINRKGESYRSTYAEWCWNAFYAASILAHTSIAQPEASFASPDGWKLVPITATVKMAEAGLETGQFENGVFNVTDLAPKTVYEAMVAAAPMPPSPQVRREPE